MTELNQWLEMAKYIGAGGSFVLGIGCWKIWISFQAELAYSKARDRETLNVLNSLTTMLKDRDKDDAHRDDRVLTAIKELKDMIAGHYQQTAKHKDI